MRAARYVFGAELRRGGWRFVLGTALLLGLVGGSALLAASGARRTASAFERLEDQTLAANVLVNPNSEEAVAALTTDRLRSIDGVAAVAHAGGLVAFFNGNFQSYDLAVFQGMSPAWFTTIDRPVVRSGRLPDQSRPDEFFANPAAAAELGLRVGDDVDLLYISADELRNQEGGSLEDLKKLIDSGAVGHHLQGRLVGIGVTAGDVVPGASLPAVLLTQAFARETKAGEVFGGDSVRLRPGASVDRFIQDVRALAPNNAAIDFQTLSSDRDTVHRAVTPQAIALVALAVALMIGAVLACAQAVGRRAAIRSDDDLALSAAGMTVGERRAVDWMRLLAVTGLGTTLAVIGAGLASSMTPIGVAREVEPAPGLAFDWVALGFGGMAIAGLVVALGVVATIRAKGAAARVARPSPLAASLRRLTASAPLAVGVGLALEPGRGRTSVPTRSTLIAACTGLVAIVASLTFAGSLRQLVGSPAAHGVTFDAMVGIVDETTPDKQTELAAAIDGDADVIGSADLYLEQVRAPNGLVSAYGLQVAKGDGPMPTLVSGRVPTRRDEVALGATTMRRESLKLGDDVTFSHGSDQTAQRFTVVGQVVLPGITQYGASDQPALGEGALFEPDGYSALTGFTLFTPGAGIDATLPITTLIDLRTGSSRSGLARSMDDTFGDGVISVAGPSKSADIESLARVRSNPLILAGLLGAVAAFAVGHALVVSVTRRRRDLAVLRTIGFTPGQVSLTVGWQATTVALIAGGIGIPVGILLGRIAWSAVARQLGVVDDPVVPLAALATIPFAVIFANLVAVVPGWRAARLRPSEILRAE